MAKASPVQRLTDHVVRDDLPPLENACREELTAELARNRQKP